MLSSSTMKSLYFMEHSLSIVLNRPVPLWVLVKNSSTFGQMDKMSKLLLKYRLRNTLTYWWAGLKVNSITKLYSHAKSVIYLWHRCSIPKKLRSDDKNDFQKTFPGVCSHLPLSFSNDISPWAWIPSEYLFQALHIFHRWIWAGLGEIAGPSFRTHPTVQA